MKASLLSYLKGIYSIIDRLIKGFRLCKQALKLTLYSKDRNRIDIPLNSNMED